MKRYQTRSNPNRLTRKTKKNRTRRTLATLEEAQTLENVDLSPHSLMKWKKLSERKLCNRLKRYEARLKIASGEQGGRRVGRNDASGRACGRRNAWQDWLKRRGQRRQKASGQSRELSAIVTRRWL